jgi:hypothetical protein
MTSNGEEKKKEMLVTDRQLFVFIIDLICVIMTLLREAKAVRNSIRFRLSKGQRMLVIFLFILNRSKKTNT